MEKMYTTSELEKLVGAGSNGDLAQVHSVPVLPFKSVLQNWEKPIPKLHQYAPNELQVTIQRKSGEVDNITPRRPDEIVRQRGRKKPRTLLTPDSHGHGQSASNFNGDTYDNGISDINYSAHNIAISSPTQISVLTIENETETIIPAQSTNAQFSGDDRKINISCIGVDNHLSHTVDGNCTSCAYLMQELDKANQELASLRKSSDERIQLRDDRELSLEKTVSPEFLPIVRNQVMDQAQLLETTIQNSALHSGSKYSEQSIHEMLTSPYPKSSVHNTTYTTSKLDSIVTREGCKNKDSNIKKPKLTMGQETTSQKVERLCSEALQIHDQLLGVVTTNKQLKTLEVRERVAEKLGKQS